MNFLKSWPFTKMEAFVIVMSFDHDQLIFAFFLKKNIGLIETWKLGISF